MNLHESGGAFLRRSEDGNVLKVYRLSGVEVFDGRPLTSDELSLARKQATKQTQFLPREKGLERPPTTPEEFLKLAKELRQFKNGKFDVIGPIAAYRQAIKLDPEFADPYLDLGELMMWVGFFGGDMDRSFLREWSRISPTPVTLGDLLRPAISFVATQTVWQDLAMAEYRKGFALLEKIPAIYPSDPGHEFRLAMEQQKLGQLLMDVGRAADGLEWLTKAIARCNAIPAAPMDPGAPVRQSQLMSLFSARAEAQFTLERFNEAIEDWDRAKPEPSAIVNVPVRCKRALALMKVGKVPEALAEADQLAKLAMAMPTEQYRIACIYSIGSTKIADKKQEYADRAMELLRNAAKGGYNDAAQIAKDRNLDPLRDREDFKKLLAELVKK